MRVRGQLLDVRDGVPRRLARAKARRAHVHRIGPAIDGRLAAFKVFGRRKKLKRKGGFQPAHSGQNLSRSPVLWLTPPTWPRR